MQQPKINLTFHGIGEPSRALDPGEAEFWVSRERFHAVLDAVAGRPDVQITFDDGNASDVEHALPALQRRGLTGAFFVCSGRIGEPGFLDAAAIRRLADAGMTVGSHGMLHRPWRELGDSDLHEELVDAKRILEDVVGHPVTEAACPFGSYDRRVLRALRNGAYRHVYTSDRGAARSGAWLQTRNTVRCRDGADIVARIGERSMPSALMHQAKLTIKRWR